MQLRILSPTLCWMALLFLLLPWHTALAQVFEVGPGHPHEHLQSIDWDNLQPGDEVRIHARPEPYREKLIIRPSGTRKKHIIIRGISGKDGSKPVIDGENALAFQETDVFLSKRALIVIGGHKNRADYIILDNLELCNANNTNEFFYENKAETYADNGAAVFVQNRRHVTITNCRIHSCCMTPCSPARPS